jgi:hypothetical protein
MSADEPPPPEDPPVDATRSEREPATADADLGFSLAGLRAGIAKL